MKGCLLRLFRSPSQAGSGRCECVPRPFGSSAGSLVEVALVNNTDNQIRRRVDGGCQRNFAKQRDACDPASSVREKDQLFDVMIKDGESA